MRKWQEFNLFFSNDLASACTLDAQQTATQAVYIFLNSSYNLLNGERRSALVKE